MSRLTRAMSPAALMISVLALIVATSAGSAYAATKIGTKQLKNNAVTSAKIKNRTVKTSDLATATRTALRGGTGPAGPVGPQGPGSIHLERTVAVNDSVTVDLPTGMLYLNCYSNQVFLQVNSVSTNPNGLWATGTYGYDGTGPVMMNSVGSSGVAISQGNTSLWADLQISDRANGKTGTLSIQGSRSGGTCRFIGQYVP
jgi:hypothetical protein